MSNTPEYERGYKDGTKDCHALYGRILDRICMALDEKGEKEQAKEARKIFAGEEKKDCLFRERREAAPSLLNRTTAKIGEVVFTKAMWQCWILELSSALTRWKSTPGVQALTVSASLANMVELNTAGGMGQVL